MTNVESFVVIFLKKHYHKHPTRATGYVIREENLVTTTLGNIYGTKKHTVSDWKISRFFI